MSGSGEIIVFKNDEGELITPWARKRENVKLIIIGDGITAIGSSAFTEFNSLTSITLPESAKTICRSAFYGCVNLEEVTIANGSIAIDDRAFYDCTKLRKISFDGSIPSNPELHHWDMGKTTKESECKLENTRG